MKIYIVIPARNEEKNIKKVLSDLEKTDYPVVVVDDGSTDKTSEILDTFCHLRPTIHKLSHRVNLGKGAAMKTGAKYAFGNGADAVIFMDADGQHKVDDLEHFKDELDRGFEVGFGTRHTGHGVPLVRYLGNKFGSIVTSMLFGIYVSDLLCGFRAVTKEAWRKMNLESSGYSIETEMVIKTKEKNLKHCEVPVETVYLDSVKGVTVLHGINILMDVIRWKIKL